MKQLGAAFLAIVVAGCSGPKALPPVPSAPTVTNTAPTNAATISGVVVEGTRPLAGAQVDNGYGPGAWATTDVDGAFQLILSRSVEPHNWVRAGKDGYAQPCAVPINGASVSVELVSRTAVRGDPLLSPNGFRTVSGVVLQSTNTGPRPVAGAWVDFEPTLEPLDDWPAAYTFTDASGRFSLCGLSLDAVNIGAVNAPMNSTGFAYVTVPPGQTYIELTLHQ